MSPSCQSLRRPALPTTWLGNCRVARRWRASTRSCGPPRLQSRTCSCSPSVTPGARGLRRLRAAMPLVDGGAASPKESWLRLLLIDAGFPAPTTQIPVHENWHLVGVLDMGWEKYKVAIEYDGDHHRSNRRQYVRDQQRLRKLEAMGWIIIRVIAEDAPEDIARRVRDALIRRGYRDT